MEAVTLHACVADLARQRYELRHSGLAAMKARVEADDLRHSRQPFPHRLDRRQVIRLMERGQWNQRTQVLQHLRCHDRRT